MATVSALDSGYIFEDADITSTAQVTPGAAAFAVVWVWGTTPSGSLTMSGCGLTWTVLDSNSSDSTNRQYLVKGVGTASLGYLRFQHTGMEAVAWAAASIGGTVNSSSPIIGTNVVKATGTGTTASVTMNAFEDAANETAMCTVYLTDASLVTPGDGFTEITDVFGIFEEGRLHVEWISGNDSAPDNSRGASTAWVAWGIEIDEAAAAATATATPSRSLLVTTSDLGGYYA